MPHPLGVLVWIEDDARPPGAETLGAAWCRMFGEELDVKKATEKHDLGDCIAYLMPNGFAVLLSYPGDSAIYKMDENRDALYKWLEPK